ncbi:hypothetical protein OG216_19515 [Streptomycetaceae bacterium NBC_01309]
MRTTQPLRTPTVAIARILRGLGLGQGSDFRVAGTYRNGERIGTHVLALTEHADLTIAAYADEIEQRSKEGPFEFRVSVQYPNGSRPMADIANYGPRTREVPPAPVEVSADARQAAEAAAGPAPRRHLPEAGSPAGSFLEVFRERAWQKRQADELRWSAGQAELLSAAGSIQLLFNRDGVLRHYPRPGWAGRTVADGRIDPLVKGGFLVITEPYGPGSKRVALTADGRHALLLWRRWRPTPTPKNAKEERAPLHPLLGGEEASRRKRAAAEEQRKRDAERDVMYAALDELIAWEERDDRLWKVWATVQGITHRLGRRRPVGWMPTPEEIAEYNLDPAAVDELRAEAGCAVPKPELPRMSPLRPLDLPPLPAAPSDEQLGLFDMRTESSNCLQ